MAQQEAGRHGRVQGRYAEQLPGGAQQLQQLDLRTAQGWLHRSHHPQVNPSLLKQKKPKISKNKKPEKGQNLFQSSTKSSKSRKYISDFLPPHFA